MNTIYCFWTGGGTLPERRLNDYESLKENSKCKTVLVTPDNLEDYIDKKYIHPAYEHLSLVHKSDYLRSCFMHVLGGGYSDIKYCRNDWNVFFEAFHNSDKYMIGTRESKGGVAFNDLNKDVLLSNHMLLPICGWFIFKKQTPLTRSWFSQVWDLMTDNHELLEEHSAKNKHPRVCKGYKSFGSAYESSVVDINEKYPIGWNDILGQIYHPLMYKYRKKIIISDISFI